MAQCCRFQRLGCNGPYEAHVGRDDRYSERPEQKRSCRVVFSYAPSPQGELVQLLDEVPALLMELLDPGVNIFQNKWIFHPGKVYHFEHFREEFPNFVIRALCRKLSFLLQGNITFLPFPSLAGNHSFPRKEPFSKRETHPLQRNPSLTGIPFPCTKTHLLK